MLRVVSVLVPVLTREGSVEPNPSLTVSSSSSTVSSTATNATVFSRSPRLKVTLVGTV